MTEAGQYQSKQEGVILSLTAKNHFLAGLKKEVGSKGIRLSLKKTGCSGLSYVLDYVKEGSSLDLVFPLEEDYSIFIERKAYPTLKGLKIDYVKEGLNQKLVFSNPNQTGQCGCGESFTVD